jgi:hypothetical protein
MYDEIDHITEFQDVSAMFETIERCLHRRHFSAPTGRAKMSAIAPAFSLIFTEHDI